MLFRPKNHGIRSRLNSLDVEALSGRDSQPSSLSRCIEGNSLVGS